MGATNEGQPQFAASRMGVGPLHIIDEVTEGNEVMEKRERQEGITSGQAKGQTQRWQPLQPNLERVNEAARRSGQTRFTALLHHVDVAALERAFRRKRRAASPGIDRVKVARVLNAVYEADFLGFSHGFRPERSPHSALAALE